MRTQTEYFHAGFIGASCELQSGCLQLLRGVSVRRVYCGVIWGLLSCGTNTIGDKAGDSDVPADTDTDADTDVQYADIQGIWDNTCAPCHIENTSGSLSLADPSHSHIVGVASSQADGLHLIEAGSLDDSYLWLKLQGSHSDVGSGQKMPKSGTLAADDEALIEAWILAGAPE